jgi:hypothetical protein
VLGDLVFLSGLESFQISLSASCLVCIGVSSGGSVQSSIRPTLLLLTGGVSRPVKQLG